MYGETLKRHSYHIVYRVEALLRYFYRVDALQNKPNFRFVRHCIGELLTVFEVSAQCEHTIVMSNAAHDY